MDPNKILLDIGETVSDWIVANINPGWLLLGLGVVMVIVIIIGIIDPDLEFLKRKNEL